MKRKRGMTLVEVIISFVIIVIVGTMIVSVFGSYLNKFKIVRDDITTKGFKNQGTVEEQAEQIIDKVSFRNEQVLFCWDWMLRRRLVPIRLKKQKSKKR